MSTARTRGIILSGDGSELIVRATDDEVRQFGRGDVVDVQRRTAAGPTAPTRFTDGNTSWMSAVSYLTGLTGPIRFPVDPNDPTYFSSLATGFAPTFQRENAMLRTRCGCTRWMQIQDPPPRDVRIPMANNLQFVLRVPEDSIRPEFSIRTFEFEGEHHEGGRRWYEYLERAA